MPRLVDIIIPVYNEERDLPQSIKKLTEFLEDNLANPWRVIIADNASTDGTRAISQELCQRYRQVEYRYLPEKGRGRALRTTWLESDADLLSYMDVDLSTDLACFPPMIKALESGYHVAIGSRLSRVPGLPGLSNETSFLGPTISSSKSCSLPPFRMLSADSKRLPGRQPRRLSPRSGTTTGFSIPSF
jgi:glycosyltransferase involved in cell wall biosynthesis